MTKEIIEKLDAIEAKQAESVLAVEAKIPLAIDAARAEIEAKMAALEAKIASVHSAPIIKIAKTVRGDVNRAVREQLSTYYKGRQGEKELKMFESTDQYDAYMKEAAGLTAGGDGQGGRTGYDPVFVPEGFDVTAAMLDPKMKNKLSHRARALQALIAKLGS